MRVTEPLSIGPKDAVLGICFFIVLGLTIFGRWSGWEFVITSLVVGLAYFASTMKQVK
ncbi:DNA helicase UvrB [Lactococcus piscium]|nr:DNA helicase UvrB [Lactococcus carnosus]MCJ1996758.1 DNA helicase UvrB [Lactococcus carnosus]